MSFARLSPEPCAGIVWSSPSGSSDIYDLSRFRTVLTTYIDQHRRHFAEISRFFRKKTLKRKVLGNLSNISLQYSYFSKELAAKLEFNGLKLIAGQTFGDQTIQCPNSNAQCYNMSASAATVLEVVKAGCSLWRCMRGCLTTLALVTAEANLA
ncbi:unnamed protein product [Strongylus vulgaris]|uniref:Uncharacterized protein n=1 Tax=Strongylus vulgaris TaxID=40348 RepID=A0A3P7IXT2_STRVU|nr:unnamed protein product [Strongylus vulgaris]